MIELSKQQDQLINQIRDWYNSKLPKSQVFIASGPAGSGKSYIIPEIVKRLKCHDPAFATFTAKATLVLKDNGINTAQTIHSLIYNPVVEVKNNKKTIRFIKRSS